MWASKNKYYGVPRRVITFGISIGAEKKKALNGTASFYRGFIATVNGTLFLKEGVEKETPGEIAV